MKPEYIREKFEELDRKAKQDKSYQIDEVCYVCGKDFAEFAASFTWMTHNKSVSNRRFCSISCLKKYVSDAR